MYRWKVGPLSTMIASHSHSVEVISQSPLLAARQKLMIAFV
jgi:hypothetical protein